jgi:transcription antitermination factor NusG
MSNINTEKSNDIRWNVLYVIPRSEKKINTTLNEMGIETFFPLFNKIRVWRNKKIKTELPLFSCYIFARVPRMLRYQVLNVKGVVSFVSTNHTPSVIPDNEIISLKKVLIQNYENIRNENYFSIGQKVMIVCGPLAGLEGILIGKKTDQRLLVQVHSIKQAFSVEIDCIKVEKITNTKNFNLITESI